MTKNTYIGLSANLSSGATGHFETFHRGIYLALKSDELSVQYIGSSIVKQGDENLWFFPIIPATLARPIAWCGLSFLKNLARIEYEGSSQKNFFVYEGNFAWSSIFLIYVIKHPNSKVLINLFDSKKYRGLDQSSILKKLVVSFYINSIMKLSQNRIFFTADTPILARELTTLCGSTIRVFPEFSVMFDHETTDTKANIHKKILVLVRGSEATKNLNSALSQYCDNCNFIIHGVDKNERSLFVNKKNIELTPGFLSEEEYKIFYDNIDQCVILYSPEDFSHQSSGRLYDCVTLGIPVSVPIGTSMAGQVADYGKFRIFDFYSSQEIRKEFDHSIEFSPELGSRSISKQNFNRNITQMFINENARPIQRKFITNFLIRIIWYAFGLYWLCRGFGLKSWKIIFWKIKERFFRKNSLS